MGRGVGLADRRVSGGLRSLWMEVSILQQVGRKLVRFGADDCDGRSDRAPPLFWNCSAVAETAHACWVAGIRCRFGLRIPSKFWRCDLHGVLRPDGAVCRGGGPVVALAK